MSVSDEVWHRIFDRDMGRCVYCNADLVCSLLAYRCAEVDHLFPPSHSERDNEKNLVLACRPCNGSLSRAHGLRLFTVSERKDYLKNTNAGFEKRLLEHCRVIGRYPADWTKAT